ncbi:hypothetical protein [Pantoea sp.]|uniref:hypothetical protein n=1 Tax=Pantoea sp. TaxID=69393 RepID=UPI0031D377FB
MGNSINATTTPAIPQVPGPPNEGNVPSTEMVAALTNVGNVPQEADLGEQTPPTPASPSPARPDSLHSALLEKINQMKARQDAEKRTAMCEALKTSGVEDVHIKAAYDEVVKHQPTSDKSPSNSFTEEVENAYLAATQETLSVKSPEVKMLAQRVMVLFNRGEIDKAQRDKVFSKLKDVKLGDSVKKAEKMAASVVEAIKTVTANDVNTAICTGLVAIMKQKGVARVDEKSLTIGLDYFNRLLHKLDSSLQGADREMAMNTALDALRYFMLPPAPSGVDTPDTRAEQSTTSATPTPPAKDADPSEAPVIVQDDNETPQPAASQSGTNSAFPRAATLVRDVSLESDSMAEAEETEAGQSQPSSLKETLARRAQAQATSGQGTINDAAISPERNLHIHIHNNHSISQNGTPTPTPILMQTPTPTYGLDASVASARPVQPAQEGQSAQAVEPAQAIVATQRAPFAALIDVRNASSPAAPSRPAVQPDRSADPRASFDQKLAFFRARENTAAPSNRSSNAFKHGIVASDRYITATSGIKGREIQRHRQESL